MYIQFLQTFFISDFSVSNSSANTYKEGFYFKMNKPRPCLKNEITSAGSLSQNKRRLAQSAKDKDPPSSRTPHPALRLLKDHNGAETAQGLVFTCALNIETPIKRDFICEESKSYTRFAPSAREAPITDEPNGSRDKFDKYVKAIAKISHNVDFVMELEREAWKRLSVFTSPHFCELLKIVPINNKSPQYCLFYKEITTHVNGGVDFTGAADLYTQLQADRFNAMENVSFHGKEPPRHEASRSTAFDAAPLARVESALQSDGNLHFYTSSSELSKFSSSSSTDISFLTNDAVIQHRETLNDILYSDQKHPAAILNCIRQVFCAIMQYQSAGITHYDLHTDNIMIANTPYDLHVYEIESDIISIPTFGITPVIIDFGLAFIENFNWAATNNFLHLGLTTFMNDSSIDFIFLLSHVVQSINIPNHWLTSEFYPEINKVLEFVKKTQTFLSKLSLDENGWFLDSGFVDINDEILKGFPLSIEGIFSSDHIYNTFSMLQFLTTVPFTKTPIKNQSLGKVLKLFQEQLLQTKTLWTETVESKIFSTNEQALFFKQIILNLADANKAQGANPEHYFLKKLKTRYPSILNLKQLRDNIKKLNISYCNIIQTYLKRLDNIKTNIYKSLPFKTPRDFIRAMPCIEYKVSPGMNVLVQKICSSNTTARSTTDPPPPLFKPYTFQLTKTMTDRINRNSSYLKRLVQTETLKQYKN